VFDVIENRYTDIVNGLGISLDLNPYFDHIKDQIAKGASPDYAASRGEYLNGLILACFLGYDFIDPAELIYFDDTGAFDPDKTYQTISEQLDDHSYAVIPGFYGSTASGKIKTFSRGGSDITGSIISYGINASVYENWTDVSGFLMADPKIVKDPKVIRKITYRELRELSYMGASVLHEESIFPVRKANIPVNIRNTNCPDNPGTLIVNDTKPVSLKGTITGIAGHKDFTVIAIEKDMMNTELGYCRRLLTILESNHISFEHIPSGIDTISIVIADSQLDGKLDHVLQQIEQECKPDSIEVFPNMALIETVGRGMAYTPGMAAKLFNSLYQANINIRMIDQGSSEINIIVGVETKDFEKAVQAIYHSFVD
jgi:aspartate kinase